MWDSKWTCSSKPRLERVHSVNTLMQPLEVASETDPFEHDRFVLLSAAGLCRWPGLQEAPGQGSGTVDRCAGARNINKTARARRVVVVLSGSGTQLAGPKGSGQKPGSQAGSRAGPGSPRGQGHCKVGLLSFHQC